MGLLNNHSLLEEVIVLYAILVHLSDEVFHYLVGQGLVDFLKGENSEHLELTKFKVFQMYEKLTPK